MSKRCGARAVDRRRGRRRTAMTRWPSRSKDWRSASRSADSSSHDEDVEVLRGHASPTVAGAPGVT